MSDITAGPAAESASNCNCCVTKDTSLGVGVLSMSSPLLSSSSLGASSVLRELTGTSFWLIASPIGITQPSLKPPPARSRSERKSPASSRNHAGRTPLWPPSKTRRTLSPAQALCKSCVWCGNTKVSSEATPKNAGHTAKGAELIGASSSGSNAAREDTSDLIISSAQLRRNAGTGNLPRLTNSSATVFKSRKAESNTQAARSWSSAARKMDVVAPIDLPHKPMEPTCSWVRK
mmetsp:Transcript_26240/g.74632  ORF Transcript_26240/g.74632 Transcript_26240/m.74632 type:complete len:233 (+) Transcript_26240:599-1297(+)